MLEQTLEREFEFYKIRHKITILQAKLTVYYKSLQESGIRVPFFMLMPPEMQAKLAVQDLILQSPEELESLYEKAWEEYAEYLP
jgi:hypothetical protein